MDEKQTQAKEEKPRLEKLTDDLKEAKKLSEDYLVKLKYAQADLENLRKRCDRQIEEVRRYANERLIKELLDIVDELELAIQSGHALESAKSIIEGVEMTLKKLKDALKKEGVSAIECVGKFFDPSRHEAVTSIENDNSEECVVSEEVRKGYVMKEKVIRPSIVRITATPQKSQEEANQDE